MEKNINSALNSWDPATYKMGNHKQVADFQHIVACLHVTSIHISNSGLPVASCSENESHVAIEKMLFQNWCIVCVIMLWMRSRDLLSSIYSKNYFSFLFLSFGSSIVSAHVFCCSVQSLLGILLFIIPKLSDNMLCWLILKMQIFFLFKNEDYSFN